MADLIHDPLDMDGDGVFWDPHIGTDNSPAAEAAREKAKAKAEAQSPKAQKQAQKKQDEEKKKATQAKKQATTAQAAAMAPATSSTSITTYAVGGLAALAVLYLLTRR